MNNVHIFTYAWKLIHWEFSCQQQIIDLRKVSSRRISPTFLHGALWAGKVIFTILRVTKADSQASAVRSLGR